jgi:hypothetical protein
LPPHRPSTKLKPGIARMLSGICYLLSVALLPVFGSVSLRPDLTLGADYTNQRYTTYRLDTTTAQYDTAMLETEARSALGLKFDLLDKGTRLDAVNRLTVSTRSFRDLLDIDFSQDFGSALQLQAGYGTDFRYYHSAFPALSDTAFRHSYWNHDARLALKLVPSGRCDVALSDAIDFQHYPQPDSLYYDYLVNRARLAASVELAELASLSADYTWARRHSWPPGTDSLSFQEHELELASDNYFDARWQLNLSNNLARRAYPARLRSYWEEAPGLSVGLNISERFGLELNNQTRIMWYDTVTTLYYHQAQNTLKLKGEYRPGSEWTVSLTPQIEVIRGLAGIQPDDYRETSVALEADFFRPGVLNATLEDRLGRRQYLAGDSSYQSDYRFNEVNLNLNWTVFRTVTLSALASVMPEWHTVATDNATLANFSLELKYGF